MGTWALPDTAEKANKLKKLLKKPLTKDEATDKLYDIFGDDQLYDAIGWENETDDVRATIRESLKELITKKLHLCFKPWEPEAIEICRQLFSRD